MSYTLSVNKGRAIDVPNIHVYYNSINVAQCRLSDIGGRLIPYIYVNRSSPSYFYEFLRVYPNMYNLKIKIFF